MHCRLNVRLVERVVDFVSNMAMQNEKCFLICLYRSPSQNQDYFENFFTKSDIPVSQINDKRPICSIVTGNFNA